MSRAEVIVGAVLAIATCIGTWYLSGSWAVSGSATTVQAIATGVFLDMRQSRSQDSEDT